MRRNLDQSEAAIIQVFEEKQRVWERQMDELRQNYASRLQQVTSQRSSATKQAKDVTGHFLFTRYSPACVKMCSTLKTYGKQLKRHPHFQ